MERASPMRKSSFLITFLYMLMALGSAFLVSSSHADVGQAYTALTDTAHADTAHADIAHADIAHADAAHADAGYANIEYVKMRHGYIGLRLLVSSASTAVSKVDLLTLSLAALSLFVLAAVFFFMFYSIVRFRGWSKVRPQNYAPQTLMPEIFWSAIPLCIFMGLFFWGSWLFYQTHSIPSGSSDSITRE
jgi:hypothetical protein